MCISSDANFQTILDKQVDPIMDPEHPGHQLNADEWMAAPTIGYFNIYEHGDPKFGHNYEPPAGAQIVRTNETEKEDCYVPF